MSFKNLLIIIVLSFSTLCGAQQQKIDSLKLLLQNQVDKNDISLYKVLYRAYERVNLDSSLNYATKYYQKSKKLKDNHIKADALNVFAIANMNKSFFPIAIRKFKEALSIGLEINDSLLIANSYNGLGNVHSNTGDFKLSLEYFYKSLPIFEKLKDTFWIASSYINIAVGFRKIKEPLKSIKFNKRALAIYELQKNDIYIALTYNNIGGIYNDIQDYNTALENLFKAKEFFIKSGFDRYVAYPLTNIAISYDSLNNTALAEKNYFEAIKIQELNNERYELAFLNNALANFYYKQGKYIKATQIGKKAITYAQNSKTIEFEATSAKTLGKSYEQLKNYKKSQFYYKSFALLSDSIFKADKAKAVLDIQTKYETVKKERELAEKDVALTKETLKSKSRSLYALLLGSGLLIVLIYSYFFRRQQKLKTLRLKEEHKFKQKLATVTTQNELQEQRLRISRDLHDNIGSQLSFIISSIENLKFLTRPDNNKLLKKLTSITTFSSDTISQLRDTIWAMNQNEISLANFKGRVINFIDKAKSAHHNIDFNFYNDTNTKIVFNASQGINLFRIIQESINNTLKYAEATVVTIRFTIDESKLNITISDNGKGFNITEVALGNGLNNIKKRADDMEAHIKITSNLNKGTSILIGMPLNTLNIVL